MGPNQPTIKWTHQTTNSSAWHSQTNINTLCDKRRGKKKSISPNFSPHTFYDDASSIFRMDKRWSIKTKEVLLMMPSNNKSKI